MSHNFVLRLAVSREVAWLATVITVIILFLIAVTLSVTKLFLWFPLLKHIQVHWFRSAGLVESLIF
jgi:hypothetical protein